jgi:hypothetical protein
MTMTNYTLGYQSKLYSAPYTTNGNAVGSYVAVAQTKDLSGPEPEVGKVNVTNNDSPANTKETAPGMIAPGDMEFEIVYTKAQANTLYITFGDQNIYAWREVYPDGAAWTFLGFLSKFGTETKTEDESITNKITITITSKPVFLPAGS